jgi:hypothetical protein
LIQGSWSEVRDANLVIEAIEALETVTKEALRTIMPVGIG